MDDATRKLVARSIPGTLIEKLGIDVTELTSDKVVASMPVAGNTQPYGLLHGGATAALAETLGSFAAMAHAAPDGIAVGVDLSITHHRGVRDGRVTAVATKLSAGKTIATYQIDVTDDSGARVATARLTCVLRPRRDEA